MFSSSRTFQMPSRLAVTLVGVMLVATACGTGTNDSLRGAPGENVGFDPVSLHELAIIGGSISEDLSPDEIAQRSQIAIEAVVVDVQRSYLNTKNGMFPSAREIESGGLNDLVVLTDVKLEVQRTIGHGTATSDVAEGQILVVTIGGGTIFTRLDADQAAALGVLKVIGDEEGEVGLPNTGDEEHKAGPPITEIEVPIDGPVEEYIWGSAPQADLSEGDEVVLFLTQLQIDGYRGAPALTYWTPVHPAGIFHRTPAGDWVSPSNTLVDVEELAKLIP